MAEKKKKDPFLGKGDPGAAARKKVREHHEKMMNYLDPKKRKKKRGGKREPDKRLLNVNERRMMRDT